MQREKKAQAQPHIPDRHHLDETKATERNPKHTAVKAYNVCNRQLKRFEQHKHLVGSSLLKLVELIELRVEGDVFIAVLSLVLLLVRLMVLILPLVALFPVSALFPLSTSILIASHFVSLTGIIIGVLVAYAMIGVIAIVYYAAFLREAIGSLTLHKLGFEFTARTMDWFKLILGHIGIVVVTLGIGIIFIGYRNWSFFIRHMEATGEVVLAELTQSTTRELRQGEGLLDAFDVGAI